MLKSKRKHALGVSLLLSTVILTSSFVITNAATHETEQVNKESVKVRANNISNKSSGNTVDKLDDGLKVEYVGSIKNMPSELKTPQVEEAFKDGNWKIKVVSGYTTYTYGTAPQNIRSRYEADCKSVNKTPNPSDVISVPQSLNN